MPYLRNLNKKSEQLKIIHKQQIKMEEKLDKNQ